MCMAKEEGKMFMIYTDISVLRYFSLYWEKQWRINKKVCTPQLICFPLKGREKKEKTPLFSMASFATYGMWNGRVAETWQPCRRYIQSCPRDTTVQQASHMVLIPSTSSWDDVTRFGCQGRSCRRMTSCLVIELILDTPEAWWESLLFVGISDDGFDSYWWCWGDFWERWCCLEHFMESQRCLRDP